MDGLSLRTENTFSARTPQPLNGKDTTTNTPQIKLNGMPLKLAVCARQFMRMMTADQGIEQTNAGKDLTTRKVKQFVPVAKNSILDRGYGDIASGVKVLEILQNEYPEAETSFIVEHFAETENELRRIVEMSTLPHVKTIILDGNDNNSNHQQLRDKAIEVLNDATVIIHAPAGLIEPIMTSSGEYKEKTLGISEYDRRTGEYSKMGKHGIREWKMGFEGNGLYLTPRQGATTGFKNETLDKLFPATNFTNQMPDNPEFQRKVLYFSYGHVLDAMNSMLRNAVINESTFERDVVFVTSLKMQIDDIEQLCGDIFSALHLTQPIKLVYEENGSKTERIIPKDADEQAAKTFNIVTMDHIDKEDFALLEQNSTFNYTSGDISTTNRLGLSKIPFVDCKKKASNFNKMSKKLSEFIYEPVRHYEEAGVDISMVPKEIRDAFAKKSRLITDWEHVCMRVSEHHNELSTDELKKLSSSLMVLSSPAWLKFQDEFTKWLKSSHSADNFILKRTKTIIERSFPQS